MQGGCMFSGALLPSFSAAFQVRYQRAFQCRLEDLMMSACDPRSAMSCLKSQACALWSSSSAFKRHISSFTNDVAPAQQSGCQIGLAFQVSAKKWGHNVAHTVVWARVCGPGIASSPLSSCTKDRESMTDFEIAESR